MAISVFDLFTIGIGPSSSHTVGPMRAALMFTTRLQKNGLTDKVARLKVHLYGSLGATGRGHGTHKAVVLGLQGETPEGVDVDKIPARMQAVEDESRLTLHGGKTIPFIIKDDLVFENRVSLPSHPNGLKFLAFNEAGIELLSRIYYSVGGGFVINESKTDEPVMAESAEELPYPFDIGEQL
ncbi:MAG: serine dehydratase beta chain, partial [Woeseiaceae bacterium]